MSPSLIESLCVREGQLQQLAYHQARVNRSLHPSAQLSLSSVFAPLSLPTQGRHKLRLLYSSAGQVQDISCEAYSPRPIASIVLIEAPELRYEHKWAKRESLDAPRQLLQAGQEPLFCQNGYLCDSSYANIALGEPGQWYTPETHLLAGTKRARLLAEGQLQTAPIHRSELGQYRYITLINAMLDLGEIMLRTELIRA